MYDAFIHRHGGCPLSPLKISLTDKKAASSLLGYLKRMIKVGY
jgi:hypothetical protein